MMSEGAVGEERKAGGRKRKRNAFGIVDSGFWIERSREDDGEDEDGGEKRAERSPRRLNCKRKAEMKSGRAENRFLNRRQRREQRDSHFLLPLFARCKESAFWMQDSGLKKGAIGKSGLRRAESGNEERPCIQDSGFGILD